MRVDAHHHLWDLDRTPQPWIDADTGRIDRSFLPADFEAAIDGHVDRSVLVQTVSEASETPLLLGYAAASPAIAAVVGWVDLTDAAVGDQLAALRESADGHLLAGIRHQVQGEADPRWLCRSDVRRGLEAVGEAGLVYDLLTLPHQLPAAIETVRALPDVQFVVDHLSKPPIASGDQEPWATEIRRLAEHPNVTCKLSGMVTEDEWDRWTVDTIRPFAGVVLDAFGPDRVMFGSDWPVCLLAASYAEVVGLVEALTAEFSHTERSAVFGGTAARIYQLGADT